MNTPGDETAWSYHIWSAKIPSVKSLEHSFMLLGEQGWELVTSVSTIKTWSKSTEFITALHKTAKMFHLRHNLRVYLSGVALLA